MNAKAMDHADEEDGRQGYLDNAMSSNESYFAAKRTKRKYVVHCNR